MMRLRGQLKYWFYTYRPTALASFPYFGTRIYFPRHSYIFQALCEQGIFEERNVRLLQGWAKPGAICFDVGANIGLMAAPVLAAAPEFEVVSFEPSPTTLPFLQRTIAESPYAKRWSAIPKAVGEKCGMVSFSVSSPEDSVFEGIKSTQRAQTLREIEVEVTTIDAEWERLGRKPVSIIKCDVEGAELGVLKGARKCLDAQRPLLLLEWNAQNLQAYGCPPAALLEFACSTKYQVRAMPSLVAVNNLGHLIAQMALTESFVLCPEE